VIPHPGDVLPAWTPDAGSMPNTLINGISIDLAADQVNPILVKFLG
jgi:hypothetical protein